MDARNSIKETVGKEDLRKGIWAQKSKKSLEKQRKEMVIKIAVVFSFLIIMSFLFLYLAYSHPSQRASFFGGASVFLFFVFGLAFLLFKNFLKRRVKEERMMNSSSAAMLHEFGKYDTITYSSMAEVGKIDENTIEKIAACIKDSLTDVETADTYTFNIAFVEEDELKLIITPRISSGRWILHDGHSPFFIALELVNIPEYEKDIFGIQIIVKREESEKVDEVIEKIKEKARECSLKFIEK